jgi:putative ABC transport system permease protein
MLNRSWISVTKNKGRSIILAVLLFVIANLVLSSMSIKTATLEAMEQTRINLGAEITLTSDRTDLFTYIREYRDNYGTRPSQDEISQMLTPISSELAFVIAQSDYVEDYNFSVSTSNSAVDFYPLNLTGGLDYLNENKLSVVGTHNILLLDQFGINGTYELTPESTGFTGVDENVVVISESLAYLNGLSIGDTITISSQSPTTTEPILTDPIIDEFTIVGFFNSQEMLEVSGKNIPDNEIYMPLSNAVNMTQQGIEEGFTVTIAKYYIDDPLNIEEFTAQMTLQFEEISSGGLTFNDINYDAITEPLANVGEFTGIILIAVLTTSVVILTLLIVNTLKDRKYEIGVLLSLGETKAKIASQYVIELILIAILAFSVATITSTSISSYLGEQLLQNEVTALEAETSTAQTTTGRGGGGAMSITPIADIEYADSIAVSVSSRDVVSTFGLGITVIIMSSIVPALSIMRFNPKQILSSRN